MASRPPGARGAPAGGTREPATREPAAPERGARAPTSSAPGSPALPRGGGAIRGIGEKLTAHPATGTGALTVPITTSPGRAGFTPDLALTYDSGAGNGPFGLGWRLSVPTIARKTDDGLPRYDDAAETDVFVLSGAEDLVPILDASGARVEQRRVVHGVAYDIRWYRPRVDELFARIERWTETATRASHFRAITHGNVTSLYGIDDASRIADPADATHVLAYLIARSFDDRGNVIAYDYAREDGAGVAAGAAHEQHRAPLERTAQRYLKRVRYGNATPYRPTWSADGAPAPLPASWHFEVVFDYGDHTTEAPAPQPDRTWPARPDPFSSRRGGFEVRTYRRCERVLSFHSFASEPEVGTDCLVRSTDLAYAPPRPGEPVYSYLAAVTEHGYRRTAAPPGYLRRSRPPLELAYSPCALSDEVRELDADSLRGIPSGLDGRAARWVDLDGEGVAGVLCPTPGGWTYHRNRGPEGPDARLAPGELVGAMPALGEDGELLDLGGDGRLDLVRWTPPAPGYHERRAGGWEAFRPFEALPQIDWDRARGGNLAFVDLTGDGLADLLQTDPGMHTWWPSRGKAGFAAPVTVAPGWDEARGPAAVLDDGTATMFLADMTGDGLADLVRVRNGSVCYWPNLGYGRFGARVAMDDAPRFDRDELFDPRRLRLADLDGTGTADLVYVGAAGVDVYFNLSGDGWSAPRRLAVFPAADELASVEVLDLRGTGTGYLVWSTPLPGHARSPVRYVDLLGGRKPHLLVACRNNLGAETRVAYAPSTEFYTRDRDAGRPWVTRLPFPVHVVECVEVVDRIHGTRFVTRYAYHHGYFDGHERELRGFGMVEQWDTEEPHAAAPAINWDARTHQPPIHTRTWFHTGAPAERTAHEHWVEPQLRGDAAALDRAAMAVAPCELIDADAPGDTREARRALAGRVARTEVYSDDGSARAEHPYVVTEHAYAVRRVQPRGPNPHAVFVVEPRETLSLHYERDPADPRVSHELVLEVDRFARPVRSVAIGYPRRGAAAAAASPAPPAPFAAMLRHDQTRLRAVAAHCRYTNDLADPASSPDAHRISLPAEEITAELRGLVPASARPAITNLFRRAELLAAWPALWSGAHDLPPEHVAASDVDGTAEPAGPATRRITSRQCMLYRSDDLTRLLPLGELESNALPGHSYDLALTAAWVSAVYGDRVDDAMLAEAGYVRLPVTADPTAADDGWWTRSDAVSFTDDDGDGPAAELAEARAHFFVARRTIDVFGAVRRVDYAHDLLAVVSVDPIGNTSSVEIDWRVLQPRRAVDPNGNAAEVAFDALGLVVGTATLGKPGDATGDSLAGFVADLDDAAIAAHLADPLVDPAAILGTASSRVVYDLFAYVRTRDAAEPAPAAVYTLARERHAGSEPPGTAPRYQHAIAYGDGLGRELQRKLLAEPGPLHDGGPAVAPRWVSSGWTIYNNKHAPVRTYEPFFSAGAHYEPATLAGVSTIALYDAADRAVATVYPDRTWDKVVVGAWRQQAWDRNDTIAIADPRTDPDAGGLFARLLGDAPGAWTSWHAQRIGGALGPAARAAALQTEAHAATPQTTHFDALGRPAVVVEDNGAGGLAAGRTAWDTGGSMLAIVDELGRRAVETCLRAPDGAGGVRYIAGRDLAGHALYEGTMDGGARRVLVDVRGETARSWDERGHAFRIERDLLRRPTHRWLAIGDAPAVLVERSLYGEAGTAANGRGRLWRTYDSGGLATCDGYDANGNLIRSTRRLAHAYREAIDWSGLAMLTGEAELDAAAAGLLVDGDTFTAATRYDALARPIQSVAPHRPGAALCVIQPRYHASGLLDAIDVWLHAAGEPSGVLDPATATLHPIAAASYNARGDRTAIAHGNQTATTYAYDPLTFRLARLVTTRPPALPADERTVQDLAYTYDPVGNVTRIADSGDLHGVIYFRNRRVEPSSDYVYDARYRLRRATGREHLALGPVGDDDAPRTGIPHPGDGNALDTYTERYDYDPAGNLLEVIHTVASGSWTRAYRYEEPSRIAPGETSNRLSHTTAGTLPDYAYDAHGNTTRMPHLPAMRWDTVDRLAATSRQVVTTGTPETTYYAYTALGERLRKTTDRAAPAGATPGRKAERLYLGVIELYRELSPAGEVVLERETLRISIGAVATALVETRTVGTDPGPQQMVRYQHGNHLGSAVLELAGDAIVVSYEEYYPYGSTAVQTTRSTADPPKRYRYTGKERDDETGLYYYGARYYASWLGRWTSTDPSGASDGPNLYAYVGGNPIGFIDPDGRETKQQAWLREFRATYPQLENVSSVPGPRSDGIMTGTGVRVPTNPGELLAPRRFYERKMAAFFAYQGFIHYAELIEAGHDAAAIKLAQSWYARTRQQVVPDDQLDLAGYTGWAYRATNTRHAVEFALAVTALVLTVRSIVIAWRTPPAPTPPPAPRGSANGTQTNSASGEIVVPQRGSVNGAPATTASGEVVVPQRGSVNGAPATTASGEVAAAQRGSVDGAPVTSTSGQIAAKAAPPPPPNPSAPGIVADASANPTALWGKSAQEIADAFNKAGFPATVRQSGRGSMRATIVEIKGHNQIQQIQVHPGGGRHVGAYVKISSNKGITKVVDQATYKPTPGEKATILDKPK